VDAADGDKGVKKIRSVEMTYPFREEQVRRLRVGDRVSVSGFVVTGRDRFHKHLFETGQSPVSLADGAIYHCGPVILQEGAAWTVRAAGPTTSAREEPYMASIIRDHRVRIVIGKGGMGEQTRLACRENGCVYLHAVGGAASLIASRVTEVRGVHFLDEFGSAEAVWELLVDQFETIVTIDARGGSLHKRVEKASRQALERVCHEGRIQ